MPHRNCLVLSQNCVLSSIYCSRRDLSIRLLLPVYFCGAGYTFCNKNRSSCTIAALLEQKKAEQMSTQEHPRNQYDTLKVQRTELSDTYQAPAQARRWHQHNSWVPLLLERLLCTRGSHALPSALTPRASSPRGSGRR